MENGEIEAEGGAVDTEGGAVDTECDGGLEDTDDDNLCFGCSPTNPVGLRLEFDVVDNRAEADFRPRTEHCGVREVVHGGLVATLIDEAIGHVIHCNTDSVSVTKSMTVDFRRPVRVGAAHRVRGWVEGIDGADIYAAGEVVDGAGRVCARGRAHFVTLSPERLAKALGMAAPGDVGQVTGADRVD